MFSDGELVYFLPVKFNQESNLLTGLVVHFRMSGNVLRQVGLEGFRIVALNGDADQFREFVPIKLFQFVIRVSASISFVSLSGRFFEVNIYDG